MVGITELFFKRKKRERGEFPDIYQYENLPNKLKVQIVYIWEESLGRDFPGNKFEPPSHNWIYYNNIYTILCKELGVFEIGGNNRERSLFERIANYFLNENDIDICLSIIELIAQYMEIYVNSEYSANFNFQEKINELNERFKENGVGYQYENKQIIRIDSQFIHSETVKPVLILLNQEIYKGAQQEFLNAHEHYRHHRYQEAMVDCLKAYESTLKIILKKHHWDYKDTDTADALTGKVMQNGLIPEYWLQYFKSLKNTLTAGVPTARNKEAGHGQADELRNIPDYLVSYVLHMTASAILFLVKAEEQL
ncbi:STM4504/CBY_0614 family protein [Neisseria dumasiana]|uniref:Abortive infection protein-like C-terminal domain-containing protein n=1 Tax=Neisseria dumasiana TaxID=1931275 RepID=A0A1X3DL08_9NEIS|nr:hypothetical protein [Neisseria dumasiana]OSI24695.1 hypothetical protein BV912_02265 [Neisseria dumasiana]